MNRLFTSIIVLLSSCFIVYESLAQQFDYHTAKTLEVDLFNLVSSHPAIASVQSIGISEEGRDIWAIKISDNVNQVENENRILFTGAHHAREWISVEVPYLLAEYLVTNYDSDELVRSIVNNQEIWIVPMLNPDGHVYSQNVRCWRKNRRNNGARFSETTTCVASSNINVSLGSVNSDWGVDVNRNYGGPKWGEEIGQTSSNPEMETYFGPSAFSEPETSAIRNLMQQYEFVSVVSYHSFSELINYPWGYTKEERIPEADFNFMSILADDMARNIKSVNGVKYIPQVSSQLYQTSGDMTDWVYSEFGIPTFTVELSPSSGNYAIGFDLPATRINTVWQENREAALHLLNTYSLGITSPSNTIPAYAGKPNEPNKIELLIKGPWRENSSGSIIETNDFTVEIGEKNAQVVSIIRDQEVTAFGIHSGFRLQVMPPNQTSPGTYNLKIKYGDAEDTVNQAIIYSESAINPGSSIILAIDTSPSMFPNCQCPDFNPTGEDRMGPTKKSAKIFIDLLEAGDQIGLVTFWGDAEVAYPLSIVDNDQIVQNQIKNIIDDIVIDNDHLLTSIGDGIDSSLDELGNTSVSMPQAIVLIGDGVENAPLSWQDVKTKAINTGIPIYTIGVGQQADQALLNDIANQTGGNYFFTPTPSELIDVYSSIQGSITQRATVAEIIRTVVEGGTDEVSIFVDQSMSEATFSIVWAGSDLDLTLITPSGEVIDPPKATNAPQINFFSGDTVEYYRIQNPEVGTWIMRTLGVDVNIPSGEPYTARVVSRTNLPLKVQLDSGGFTGDRIKVSTNIADTGQISNAVVNTKIRLPNLTQQTLSLLDDGLHEDGMAADGVYANFFYSTSLAGTYQFTVHARGVSSVGNNFTRQGIQSTFINKRAVVPDVIAPSDVELSPGNTYETLFKIENPENEDAIFDLVVGPPEEILWTDVTAIPNEVTVPAGTIIEVPITIIVPPAEARPIHSSIVIAASNEDDHTSVDSDSMEITVPTSNLEIVSFDVVDPPSQVLIGDFVSLILRKFITNHGPKSPIDARLIRTTEAPIDSSVAPTDATTIELALDLNENREVDEEFTIQCGFYGNHEFHFKNKIQTADSNIIDPILGNNFAEIAINLECVVPVKIDVKPKQINLNGSGVVTVEIYKNEAGEYGLPLPFDPETIDPNSVKFGSRDDIWHNRDGATEAHGQDHGGGNSDKRTYHFRANESGLMSGDKEACVKGTWYDENGDPYIFFGCDEVTQIIPSVVTTLSQATNVIPTGGHLPIKIKVSGSSGIPMSDINIGLSAVLGTVDQELAKTNKQGEAFVEFNSNGSPGQGKVIATYQGVRNTFLIDIEPPRVDEVSLNTSTTQVSIGEVIPVTVVIKDQFGQPIADELISFSGSMGLVSLGEAITNQDGEVTVDFTAGSNLGIATVFATAQSINSSINIHIVNTNDLALSSVSPNTGTTQGGELIVLSGKNFSDESKIFLSGYECKDTVVVNTEKIQCNTPPAEPGFVDVRITSSDATEYLFPKGYKYSTSTNIKRNIYLPIITK
jgi:carboxypeptidase T